MKGINASYSHFEKTNGPFGFEYAVSLDASKEQVKCKIRKK